MSKKPNWLLVIFKVFTNEPWLLIPFKSLSLLFDTSNTRSSLMRGNI